jgi:hypothetical protein
MKVMLRVYSDYQSIMMSRYRDASNSSRELGLTATLHQTAEDFPDDVTHRFSV